MGRIAWCLAVLLMAGFVLALASQPAAAQGEYVNVAGLRPFTAESNYMSLAGYLRWMTYSEQRVWLSMPEAQRIVTEQLGR